MRRKTKSPFFYLGLFRNFSFYFDGASTTRSQPAAMNCLCDAVIERKFCGAQYLSQVRAFFAFDRLTLKSNLVHQTRSISVLINWFKICFSCFGFIFEGAYIQARRASECISLSICLMHSLARRACKRIEERLVSDLTNSITRRQPHFQPTNNLTRCFRFHVKSNNATL